MRLTPDERQLIELIVRARIANVKVYLFGSRVDDAKKGGDIDLLILSETPVDFDQQSAVYWSLQEALGEQKIDIVYQQTDRLSTFGQIALQTAVAL